MGPAVVVPDIGSPQLNKYFLLKPRDEWAGGFARWVEDEYYLDDMGEVDEDPPSSDEESMEDGEEEGENDEEEADDEE